MYETCQVDWPFCSCFSCFVELNCRAVLGNSTALFIDRRVITSSLLAITRLRKKLGQHSLIFQYNISTQPRPSLSRQLNMAKASRLLWIKMMSVNLSHLWLVWRSVTSLELETTVSQRKISSFLLKKLKTYKSVLPYRFAILSVKSTNQNHFPRWIEQCFIVDCFQARCSLATVIR